MMMHKKLAVVVLAVLLTINSFANVKVYRFAGPDASGIIYVKQGGTGDGSSWANAIGNLQTAINEAGVKEVWVAKGEYLPAVNTSFSMKSFVKIYGGFPNTGTPNMTNRNWRTYETILKGNGSSVIINNSIMNANAILDGFTVTAGVNYSSFGGGGMLNQSSSSPTVINCTFKANSATRGGGMANFTNSPTITNCVFLNNTGSSSGGGIYNENSALVIKASIFSGNKVTATSGHNGGGAIYNTGTYTLTSITDCVFNANEAEYGTAVRNAFTSNKNQEIINCTFYNNKPSSGVAAPFYNSFATTTFVNTIFWNNSGINSVDKQNGADPIFKYCLQQGINLTTDGNLDGTNLNNNPQFVDVVTPAGADTFFGTADDGLALKNTSPLVGKGSNELYPGDLTNSVDVTGAVRLAGTAVDLGAYEELTVLPVNFGELTVTKQLSGVKLQWHTYSETDNQAFIIKRSADGKSFIEVGRVTSKGNSNSLTNYLYSDNLPLTGLNYYQLQQVDLDGTTTTLGYGTVNFNITDLVVKVYPNPAIALVNVSLGKTAFREAKLINIYGRQLISKSIGAEENLLTFDVSNFPSGIYFIELSGDENESIKLLKK